MSRTPLNAHLRFVTEAGKIDEVAIFADIPRKAAEIHRSYIESGGRNASSINWRKEAEADLRTFADGELQLWEMRKITRDQGLPTNADLIAPVPVGPLNDNHETRDDRKAQFDAALNAVRFAVSAE